ncbi:MAG: peptide-methionine (R)-S-oxide reductase MsrB [Halanaerobiaceae bacterium]
MVEDNKKLVHSRSSFWREKLTTQEYEVLVEMGTDPAFDNEYYDKKERGLYVCRACGQVLFVSEDKYESGTGWPSFSDVIEAGVIDTEPDNRLKRARTEIHCSRCGGHLGHVFKDGPEPTGLRYCTNTSSLKFLRRAYLALGCFWGPDSVFGGLDGVYFTAVGYAGGDKEDPTYHDLGDHTETVRIDYDPEIISFHELLETFAAGHSMTSNSPSTQYNSIIFFIDKKQKKIAEKFWEEQKRQKERKIQTGIRKLNKFYLAEDYHQKYYLQQNNRLSGFVASLLQQGEVLTYSRIMTVLNALCGGNLSKGEMISFLDESYLFAGNRKLVHEIVETIEELDDFKPGC